MTVVVDPIKVLLIEDDEEDYFLIKQVFKRVPNDTFDIEWMSSFDAAIDCINEDRHDIYLVDYKLGAHTGLDVLRKVHPEQRRQPFILLTGTEDKSLERRTSKLAAADFLVKGSFNADTLSRTINYALERKRLENERVEALLELNNSKDEFISIASHQLRTPATAVKQYIGMALDGFAGTLSDTQRGLLDKAMESNERQLSIVNDLLKVARVDSGKMSLYWDEIQIDSLIREVIADQQAIIRAREQSVLHEPLDSPRTVSIDTQVVRMVLENLLDNASKYSEEGTSIKISTCVIDDNVSVSISDEGVGVKPGDEQRLFVKFSRISNPLSTKVGGTGLGLYWAKKIMDLHGGNIGYSRNSPHGSVFTLTFPSSRPGDL